MISLEQAGINLDIVIHPRAKLSRNAPKVLAEPILLNFISFTHLSGRETHPVKPITVLLLTFIV